MPTAPTTTASGAKAARKPARRKPRAAKKTSTTAKARRSTQAASARTTRTTHVAQRDPAELFGEYAERAVLIPVGAALIARDRMVSTVSDTLSNYSSPSRAQAQLRRFERRGTTARKRLEREVRKARTRVERELRQRRRDLESTVSDIDSRREAVAKSAGRVQERILKIV